MATYYWVGGSGTWDNSSTANWSGSSGGAGGAGVPTNADTAIFDSNSGTAATVTVAASAVSLSTTVNKSDINLSLSGSPTLCTAAGALTLTAGTLTLNTYTLTVGIFSSSNSNARTIAFGTGNITLTGNATTIHSTGTVTNLTVTGTPIVNATYSGGTGTRTFIPGSTSEATYFSFNITAGTDIVAFASGSSNSYKNVDFTGFAGTFVMSTAVSLNLFGNLKISTGMSFGATLPSVLNLSATSGTQQITSSGKTFNFPVTQNGVGGTVQLQDNLTMGSTRTYTLTNGTLDLTGNSGNWTLSTGLFASSNSNTRSIAFGTGNIDLTGNNGSIWNVATATGLTYTGTPTVNSTYSGSTGTRTLRHGNTAGGTEANAVTINITAGSDATSFAGAVKNFSFSSYTGAFNTSTISIYGNLTYISGMTMVGSGSAMTFAATSGTQTVTTGGLTVDQPITINSANVTVQLQDNLTIGSTRTLTLTAGTLDLSNGNRTLSTGLFASSNSNTRIIKFGTGNLTLTGSGTVWNTGTVTNFSYTGTPTVNVSNNSATATTVTTGTLSEAQALNFNYTVGTYTLTDTSSVYKNLNFTGFTGTVPNSARTIYGNLTIVAGATNSAGANATTFAGTSGTQQITTNGVTLDYPLTFNGIGGTFAFQDAVTQGSTRAFTVTNGTVQLKNGVTSTVGSFATSGANLKTLRSTSSGSRATLSQASGTVGVSNLIIQDISATGGATFNAFSSNNNVDAGNNTGWDFGAALSRSLSRTWARSGDRSYAR